MKDSYLTQHVNRFTRYREGETPNILDLVFTNEEEMISNIDYGDPLGKSDHLTLEFMLRISSDSDSTKTWGKPKYFRGNYDVINTNLKATNWENKLAHQNSSGVLGMLYR